MDILTIIVFGILFSLIIFLIVLYVKTKNKLYQAVKDKENSLSIFKKELSPSRKGFYKSTLNIMSPSDKEKGATGEPYTCVLYVRELDRYTNGMSKIELTDVELISGFDISQFDHVKKSMRTKFSSVKTTDSIEWLESEENIKESRRQKLEKIINGEK